MIDAKGLDAFSLDLAARKLGVRAPSFYHHFRDKAELLAEVARLILLDVNVPKIRAEHWEEDLVRLCVETRRSILRHPHAAPLLLSFGPRRVALGGYENTLAAIGMAPEQALVLIEGTENITYGSALFEAAARAEKTTRMPKFDAKRYPTLARAVATAPADSEETFLAAIRAYVQDMSARMRAKPRKPAMVASRAADTAVRAVAARRRKA